MKRFFTLFTLSLMTICHAGPPDAESIGLRPTGFIEVSDQLMEQVIKESVSLTSAFIPREMRSHYKEAMEPVGWFDKDNKLCQIRSGGQLPKDLFEKCTQQKTWKPIGVPSHYLKALHIPSDEVKCFDGQLDGCSTHILWIAAGETFMIVADIGTPQTDKK